MSTFPPTPPSPEEPPKVKAGMAKASIVLGVCGLITCGLTAVIGFILGIVAYTRTRGQEGASKVRNLAIAGIIISALMIPVSLPMVGVLIYIRSEIQNWVQDTWAEAAHAPPTGKDSGSGGQLIP